jgi:hypothetical protein
LKPVLIDPEPSDFAQGDGASHYSYENWLQAAEKPSTENYRRAMHETLAEMARVKFMDGKFPPHLGDTPKEAAKNAKVWRSLYRAVDKVYNL